MRVKWFAAAAAAVALGVTATAPAPVRAQVQVTDGDRAAHARLAQIQAANERVQMLLVGIISDPAFASADTPEKMLAALKALKPRIAAARAELRRLSADFASLPPLPPSATSQVVESMGADLAMLAGMVDRLLADLEGLLLAVENGDEAKVLTLADTLASGIVALIDAQAQGLRGRAAALHPMGSAALQLEGLACLYDGYNAFNRAHFGMIGRDEAAAGVERAVACMDRQVRGARAALRMEQTHSAAALGPVLEDYVRIRSAMHDRIDAVRLDLAALAAGLAAGEDYEALDARISPRIMQFEQELTALNGEEIELLKHLSR